MARSYRSGTRRHFGGGPARANRTMQELNLRPSGEPKIARAFSVQVAMRDMG